MVRIWFGREWGQEREVSKITSCITWYHSLSLRALGQDTVWGNRSWLSFSFQFRPLRGTALPELIPEVRGLALGPLSGSVRQSLLEPLRGNCKAGGLMAVCHWYLEIKQWAWAACYTLPLPPAFLPVSHCSLPLTEPNLKLRCLGNITA